MVQNKNRTFLPVIMVSLGVLFIVIFLFWYLNPSEGTEIGQVEPGGSSEAASIPFPEIKRVLVQDAKAAYELKQAIFIDTRGEPFFSEGHIPGALSITKDEISDRMKDLDPELWYIIYCT